MATTLDTLRQKVAEELEDKWASRTTSLGAADGTTLIDSALSERPADWAAGLIEEGKAYVLLPKGPTGAGSPEERPLKSLTSSTLTVERAFSAQTATNVEYEGFHVFKGSDVEAALKEALDLCLPHLYDRTPDTSVTTTANVYAYDVSTKGFYKNELSAVEIQVDTGIASYPYQRLTGWTVRPDGFLQFPYPLRGGRKLRLYGVKRLAFSGSPLSVSLDPPETTILQARAIAWLAGRRVAWSPAQDVARWKDLEATWLQRYQERAAKFGTSPPPGTVQWEQGGGLRPHR
jgi:hypothetical protein